MPQIDTYTTGTVALTQGSAVVTGAGTDWISGPTYRVVAGHWFRRGAFTALIVSVDSATQITLAQPWTAASEAGVSYQVFRYTAGRTPEVVGFLQSLLDRGGPDAPLERLDIDTGLSRLSVRADAAGNVALFVGDAAAADESQVEAIEIAEDGAVSFRTTGGALLPSGTTAQRRNVDGVARYNTTTGRFEVREGGSWREAVRRGGDTMAGALGFSGTNHHGLAVVSLTQAQRDALAGVPDGAVIRNTTTGRLEERSGGVWLTLARSLDLPAVIRPTGLRYAWDSSAFRDAVNGGTDAADALEALLATPGTLVLPDQGESIRLSRRIATVQDGLHLRGTRSTGAATRLVLTGPSAGIDFNGVQDSGIEGVYVLGSSVVLQSSGAAIRFAMSGAEECYGCHLKDIFVSRAFNGIEVFSATNTQFEGKIELRELLGGFGVQFYGVSAATRADALTIGNIVCDAPYALPAYPPQWKGAMQRSTAYAAGDVAFVNGRIYQCVQAGTTASGSAPSTPGTVSSRDIVDGSVIWRFICSDSLAWIVQGSYGYSLDVLGGRLINGAYGYRMLDAINDGSSYPVWGHFTSTEFDHPAFACALCEAGEDFKLLQGWASSTLAGNGFRWTTGYRGEGGVIQSNVRGNAQHGALYEGGPGWRFLGNDVVDNGQAQANTYHGVVIGAGVRGFIVQSNAFIPQAGLFGQSQSRAVLVQAGPSDGYVIADNVARGLQNPGQWVSDGGTGVNKRVEEALPF